MRDSEVLTYFVDRNSCLSEDRRERPDRNRVVAAVKRHGRRSSGFGVTNKHMASSRMDDFEAQSVEGAQQAIPRNAARQLRTQAGISTVRIFGARREKRGRGWLNFSRASRQHAIASRAFFTASASVLPHVRHSGRPGTETEKVPFSSGVRTILKRLACIVNILP